MWPEKYPVKEIEQIKLDTGANKFESQMMLHYVNIMEGRLNPDLLRFYDDELKYCDILDELYIGNQRMISVSSWWDPSFASSKGDNSVLAVLFADMGGNCYLHHIEYIKINENNEESEAHQQAHIVAKIAKKYRLPAITVETNGIGIFLPKIMFIEFDKLKIPTRARKAFSKRAKDLRILENLDGLMSAQRLFVHRNICKTPFIMEMREWRPGKSSCYDDGLDAVSGAISMEPDRLDVKPRNMRNYSWMDRSRPHNTKGKFEV